MKHALWFSLPLLILPAGLAAETLPSRSEAALRQAVSFFHSINAHGGYVYHVTPDLSQRWGEGPKDADTIEVQPPGTPAVGKSFLRAYQATGDPRALAAARQAADALIKGQNKHGGWDHTIDFANLGNQTVSFDDNQSQSALSFLMALNHVASDETLAAATRKAIGMMLHTQLENGGWPHLYPPRGNYHDYATFNDGGINDCVQVMIEARNLNPRDEAIERSLRRAARFFLISQQPPPQPAWAQQYNEFMQPAWARAFEPASLCPAVTVRNIGSLVDLYLALGDQTLLEPIPDALRWLEQVRLPNGKWARFVEIGTNNPLYYDRGRIRVESIEELHPERSSGYAYQTDLAAQIDAAAERFEKAITLGRKGLQQSENQELSHTDINRRIAALAPSVERIIAAQEPSGAWISRNDRFKSDMPEGVRWNGQYTVADRISSAVFNRNVATLCEFLELNARLQQP